MGAEHDGQLRPEDEGFHVVADQPFQTEGSWWCFFEPERRLEGWIYHQTRLNLGLATGGVWVWDHTATQWYDVPYYAIQYLQPVTSDADLRDMRWADGTRIRSTDPLRRYEVTYRDGDALAVELEYEALGDPYVSVCGNPTRPYRYDQPSRATGRVVLHGEEIAIDCIAMFDHSWSVRPDPPLWTPSHGALHNRPVCYLWGTASADHAFFVMNGGGRLVQDGRRSDLEAVVQQIDRDPITGLIQHLRVTGVDSLGRALEATGSPQNLIIRPSNGSYVAFVSMMSWNVNGRSAIGDIQDLWSAPVWASFRRNARSRLATA